MKLTLNISPKRSINEPATSALRFSCSVVALDWTVVMLFAKQLPNFIPRRFVILSSVLKFSSKTILNFLQSFCSFSIYDKQICDFKLRIRKFQLF